MIGHRRKATLTLEDGTTYEGWSLGALGESTGEGVHDKFMVEG